MAEAERDQRLTHRVDNLYATDPQFRVAAPLQEVTDAAHGAGLRLWEVVEEYLNGYADRPALGQRAREVTHDETTGRRTTTLLSGFDTITYGRLRDRVTALASVWQSSLPGGFHPGDFVAVLGFTSIGYAMINLACIRLGAVFVPLQTSSTAGQLAPIVAETEPRIFAASIESLDVAVDVVLGASSVERLVVFDYLSDDDEQRERYQSATARLAAAGRTLDVVPLLEDLDAGAGLPEAPPFVPPVGEDPLATLIYTSGSTGTPQGRDVHHRSGGAIVAASARPVAGYRYRDSGDPPAVHAAQPRLRAGVADRHPVQRWYRILCRQERHVHLVRGYRAGSSHRVEPCAAGVRHDLSALPQRAGPAAGRRAKPR